MKTVARIVAVVTLLAFGRGPALACYALPPSAATPSDVCCHMMGMSDGAGCSSRPASSRPCCHPDNLGDQAYLRASTLAAPTVDAPLVLLVTPPAIGRPLALSVLSPAVLSHAPPGRITPTSTVLRL